MAELSTIARPYAEALFSVARTDSAGLASWVDLLNEVALVAQQADVAALLDDPKLGPSRRVEIFSGVIPSLNQVSEAQRQAISNFLLMLADNDRLSVLAEIATQFSDLRDAYEGSAKAQIVSALPISDSDLAELLAALQRRFGRQLKAEVTVDASLIGGVRVVVGDQVLDTSVSAQLDRMRDTLVA